jgi:hypothetical protein
MGRDPTWFDTFECPECKVLTDIAVVPPQVREAAKRHPRSAKGD